VVKKEEAPPPESEMSITLSIEKPEIILIEDQSNPSSNALILDVSIHMIIQWSLYYSQSLGDINPNRAKIESDLMIV
jgi:hypothetical protein